MAKPPPLFDDELPRRGGMARQGGRTSRGPRHWQGTPAQRLRVVLGYNQAVMKITSYGSGRNAVYDQLTYISRDGELALETERGEIVHGLDDLPSILDEWEGSFDARVRSRDTMHMVMSAPAGTDETRFTDACRDFASETFSGNHSYIFALHTDKEHPHVHLLVVMRGHDGTKLDPRKADLARWREALAEKAREQGIELDASPRYARGKGKKSDRQMFRNMLERDEAPERVKAAIAYAAKDGQDPYAPNAFEEAQLATNRRERQAYADLAAEYAAFAETSDDPRLAKGAAKLARLVRNYADTMPVPETRRQLLLRAMASKSLISQEGAPKGAQPPGPVSSLNRGASKTPDRDQGPER